MYLMEVINLALTDQLGQTTPQNQVEVIQPVADVCVNASCMFFNLATNTCALEECLLLNPPAVVHQTIIRKCDVCGGNMSVFAGSASSVCPSCAGNIRRAIQLMHSPGSD